MEKSSFIPSNILFNPNLGVHCGLCPFMTRIHFHHSIPRQCFSFNASIANPGREMLRIGNWLKLAVSGPYARTWGWSCPWETTAIQRWKWQRYQYLFHPPLDLSVAFHYFYLPTKYPFRHSPPPAATGLWLHQTVSGHRHQSQTFKLRLERLLIKLACILTTVWKNPGKVITLSYLHCCCSPETVTSHPQNYLEHQRQQARAQG